MNINFLQVLDEADRMLDMGFEQEVRSILGQTCSGMQSINNGFFVRYASYVCVEIICLFICSLYS